MGHHYLSLVIFVSSLCFCHTYTLRNSVSWAVSPKDVVVEEELDALSEEVSPSLLRDNVVLWKQAYAPPQGLAAVEGAEISPGERIKSDNDEDVDTVSSHVFSYRVGEVKEPGDVDPPPHDQTARTARYIAHHGDWGHLATISTQEKVAPLADANRVGLILCVHLIQAILYYVIILHNMWCVPCLYLVALCHKELVCVYFRVFKKKGLLPY